jgi:biotin operon repressor
VSKQTILPKMRFVEHVAARRDLTDLQRRVAIRLVSLFNVKRGYAYPSYDGLADDLGASRRKVIDAVNKLVELGLFVIVRRGGRGHANEYAPAWDAIPDGCPFAAERVTRASPFSGSGEVCKNAKRDAERVTLAAQKGDPGGINSDRSVTPSGLYTSGLESIRPAQDAAAPLGERGAHLSVSDCMLSPDERVTLGELQRMERQIKAGMLDHLTQEQKADLQDRLDTMSLDYERQEGHPVGGLALRLAMAVEQAMDYDEDGVPIH